MASIEQVLDGLDPPLKHCCTKLDGSLELTLIDPHVPARVQRQLSAHEVENPVLFQVILLYAINELRGMGSHAPLDVLPMVDPMKVF